MADYRVCRKDPRFLELEAEAKAVSDKLVAVLETVEREFPARKGWGWTISIAGTFLMVQIYETQPDGTETLGGFPID